MHFQLAWRNVWRNPRRTTVILIAVIIGVWSMIFLNSLSRGFLVDLEENGIATLTGHIQILAPRYHQDPVVDNRIEQTAEVRRLLQAELPPGSVWAARVCVNAIASNARHSSGVTLVGIEPDKEARLSFIGGAVSRGEYLAPDDDIGILVGQALLDKFETKLGNKLVLMSQDTGRQIGSRAFRIRGVFRTQLEFTEKQYVFVVLPAAQKMLKMDGAVSQYAVLLPDSEMVDTVAGRLQQAAPDDLEVWTWKELLPLVKAYLGMMDGFIFIWNLVVFVAMGFGLVNTVLMAVYERMREFGLLKALGMRPGRILQDVLIEGFYLLSLGLVIGNVLGFVSVWALAQTGIDLSAVAAGSEYFGISRVVYPVLAAKDVIMADVTVFVLGLLVSAYPALKAARFTPVEALGRT
ncbi:MAG: ABC transporter permease [Acidobacteria bacterium]|nr:ABC transporter permease [Acidobacteriota bacterium]